MKQINVWFEDNEHEYIRKIKDEIHGGNWHDFLMDISREYKGDLKPLKGADDSIIKKRRSKVNGTNR